DLDRNELRGADGTLLPLRRAPDGQFYLEAGRPGLLRVATTVNDMAQVTQHGRYWLDMRPSGPEQAAQAPLIAGLRRKWAANVWLWPAPWLHRIGNDGFPGAPLPPSPGLSDCQDIATWRGPLSGFAVTPDGQPDLGHSAESLIAQALSAPPKAPAEALPAIAQAVRRLTRWHVPDQYGGRDGFDLALTPDPRQSRALDRLGLTPAARTDSPQGRYALCLG
ncbi:MAG: hypothetical protein ACK4YU_13585, partial [Paracoccus sp. (in: a-proteobacteria)]